MKNFKEIVEKCLVYELSGTFIIQGDKNWHSSYLQRHAISGNEIPGQYVLGPGVIYNEVGQCISNEKIKIIDFIPDTMKNFKEIAEKCFEGELSGTFILRCNRLLHSKYLIKMKGCLCPYYIDGYYYSDNGNCYNRHLRQQNNDIINFIPDNGMQEQIKIDIPEDKVPVMEQTESGVVITWKEKELTYADIINKIASSPKHIIGFSYGAVNDTTSSSPFYRKVEVLRKLTNIRNYFGKPDGTESGFYIYKFSEKEFKVAITGYPAIYANDVIAFAKREHAEQAVKILGDELKYLFEPW